MRSLRHVLILILTASLLGWLYQCASVQTTTAARPEAVLVAGQKPSLSIHHLGLAEGDATLIVLTDLTNGGNGVAPAYDTTVILIDAQREYCAAPLVAYVDSILNKVLRRNILDIAVVSHLHIDHMGGMVATLTGLLAKRTKIRYVVDRLQLKSPLLDNANVLGIDTCYKYLDLQNNVISTPNLSAASTRYEAFVRQKADSGKFKWMTIVPKGNLLKWKNFQHSSIYCVASGGASWTAGDTLGVFIPKSSKRTRRGKWNGMYNAKSENDLSLVFKLQFGSFNYYTGGDLGGLSPKYADGETPIAQLFASAQFTQPFHMCAMKVNHHGSASSSNQAFIDVVKPTIAVISAACRSFSGTQLPTAAAIARINQIPQVSIRYTFVPSNPNNSPNVWRTQHLQDVVIQMDSLPTAGADVHMLLRYRLRNPEDRNLLPDAVANETIVCTKQH